MEEIEHEVLPQETVGSIARAYGIAHWEDLWDHNPELHAAFPTPDLLAPRDREGRPVVVRVPVDPEHSLGRRLLRARGVPLERAFGGTSWRDPRALVSLTLHDARGEPLPPGTAVRLVDPLDGTSLDTVVGDHGQVKARLALHGYEVLLPVAAAQAAAFIPATLASISAGAAERPPLANGDAMNATLDDPPPRAQRTPPSASADVLAARATPPEPIDFEPMARVELRPGTRFHDLAEALLEGPLETL